MVVFWTIALIVVLLGLFVFFVLLDIYLGYKKFSKGKAPSSSPARLNDVEWFNDGRRFFDRLKNDIKSANHHIHLSFFIFRSDWIGGEIIDALIAKAREGVKVRLLIDALNGLGLTKKARKSLREAGVELAFAAKPFFPFFFYALNHRYHRKIAVIDGSIGYLGGFNVGDEYLGRKAEMGDWRDYHIRIVGQGVKDLQDQFLKDWETATRNRVEGERHYPTAASGPHELQFIATDGCGLEDLYIHHFRQAEERLVIGSPYFVPSRRLQAALMGLLERGVELTILLPAKKDHPFVRPVSYRYLTPLLKKGARVYHFYQGFYHAKAFIVDRKIACLGTANFDMRSLYWNDEINGFFYDRKSIEEIEAMMQKDLHQAYKVTLRDVQNRPLLEKIKTWLSAPLAPFL